MSARACVRDGSSAHMGRRVCVAGRGKGCARAMARAREGARARA